MAAASRWAAAALVFNAFTWGVSWWPFRQLQAVGLHPLWVTSSVYLLACAVLLWRRAAAGADLLRTPALWALVLASGTTNATFNWAVSTGDVVRVVLLFYLMPLWSAVLAWPLLGERLSAGAAARVAMALAGAWVVLRPESGGWPVPRDLAEVLGVVGGMSFALNNVLLRREAHRPEDARALAMFGGGVAVAAALALVSGVPMPGAAAAANVGALAAVGALALWYIGSNLALQYGAARLSAHATALIMLTEVVFAAGSALALGAARPEWRTLLGGALIVGAALLAARRGG